MLDGVAHRGQRPAGFPPPAEHRTPDRLALPGASTAVVIQAVLAGADPHFMALPVNPARMLVAAATLALAVIRRRRWTVTSRKSISSKAGRRRSSYKPSARPNVVATHARNLSQSNDGYGWEL